MTATEVAKAAHVDASTVLRWARNGRLPKIDLPGASTKRASYRFRRCDVEALLTPTPVRTEAQ